jgi:hypothetical protein
MKRLLLSAIIAIFTLGLFAQHTDGTGTGWEQNRRKQNFKDSTYFSVSPVIKSGQYIDSDDYYVLLSPDTVQHTADFIVAASDWGSEQHCLKTTSIAITIPPALTDWPIGGVMNFWGEGAGIMVFKKGVGVAFISDTDSIATSRKGQVVTVKKIATNKYWLVGPLTD